MLRNARVTRYLHALRNQWQKRYAVELDDLITQLTAIINADPNALSQYRRVNCRYCWGESHKYQWRDIEEQLQAEKRVEIHTAGEASAICPCSISGAAAIRTSERQTRRSILVRARLLRTRPTPIQTTKLTNSRPLRGRFFNRLRK